jgi:hypothetical protein
MSLVRRALVLSALALFVVPGVAHAGPVGGVNDPNDTAGKLDMDRVEGIRTVSGGKVVFKISFHSPLDNATLKLGGGNFLKILLNADDDPNTDYIGSVYAEGGNLTVMFAGSGQQFENLPVSRPNDHTLKFTVPEGTALTPNGPLGMRALSAFTSASGACMLTCLDEAPNSGSWILL